MAQSNPGMTSEQALSILESMRVEQETLNTLLPQFMIAIGKVGEVITYYREINNELPGLVDKRDDLRFAISQLQPQLEQRKKQAISDENTLKVSLDKESVELRKFVENERVRLRQATQDADEAEKRTAETITRLNKMIKEQDERLVKAIGAFEKFKQDHGL